MNRNWTPEEDELILYLQRQWGNSWAAIAQVRIIPVVFIISNYLVVLLMMFVLVSKH